MKLLYRMFLSVMIGVGIAVSLVFQAQARDGGGDIVIIVDPGHGGNDGGAASAYDNEADLNWQIARALKAELQTYEGVKVYLTRGSAEWNSNAARGRMGAGLGADLFVSVHNNSSTSAAASGVQVYGTINSAYKAEVSRLCNMIAQRVGALGLVNGGYHARPSTDDPSVDFYTMLDEAAKCGIPGLIIEHCYLSNGSDAAFIHNDENKIKCGIADATAIAEYFGLSKRGVAAGSEITLIRTYSACMTGTVAGTYSSSDTSVAYVSPEGVITAVGEGSAVVTCTGADGGTQSVTVKVPAVGMIGIAAGINPTFYSDPAAASAYDRSTVMVKAIYGDGHVEQLSGGFELGAFPASDNGIFDVPVSCGGFTCPLRIYGVGGYLGNYNVNNYKVTGVNADILLFPPVYNGINTGIRITTGGSMQVVAPIVAPTEAPTAPPPTKAPEAPTEGATGQPTDASEESAPETSAEPTAGTKDRTEDSEETTGSKADSKTESVPAGTETKGEITSAGTNGQSGKHTIWFYAAMTAGIIAGASAVACIAFLAIRHGKDRKR